LDHFELVLLGLLVAVAGLALAARLLRVPYPIFLVLGGLALGFIPGVPHVELEPDLVLLIFLPPLLYSAAFFSSLRDMRANVRPIALLSVGLVLATMGTVAAAAHYVVGLSWPVALVLGAIVSPTDAVAPATILRRLGVPRRIVTVVEGENLTNDWAALVFYRLAVGAVVAGATLSVWEAGFRFLLSGPGGFAVGLAVAWLVAQVRKRIDDSLVEITISLFTGYAAYLAAEELGLSGVISAVTAGVYLGWRSSELTAAGTRLQAYALWEILEFLLNAVLFVLIGLQLPQILEALLGEDQAPPVGTLVLWGAFVGAVVILTRLVWVFLLTYLPRMLFRSIREKDPVPPWQQIAIVSWAGMRGSVSLAAALAIPLTVASGAPFPSRDLLIFLTFCVILATLVLQGLSLPVLINALGVEDDGVSEKEELKARLKVARAAVARVDELADEGWVREDTAERMRGLYDYRRRRFAARFGVLEDGDGEDYEDRSTAFQRFQHEVLLAERAELLRLRNEGLINDEVMRRVERDLDLEEARLEV